MGRGYKGQIPWKRKAPCPVLGPHGHLGPSAISWNHVYPLMCACVFVCVCVCERERERERGKQECRRKRMQE